MPRAALLSIHVRVEGTEPGTWEDPSLVQVWGPRFTRTSSPTSIALFTVGRMPDAPARRAEFEDLADRIEEFLEGRRMDCREVGRGLGRHPVSLRYAAPTGRVLIRWDGRAPANDLDGAAAGGRSGRRPSRARRRYLQCVRAGDSGLVRGVGGHQTPRAGPRSMRSRDRSAVHSPTGEGGSCPRMRRRCARRSMDSRHRARLLPSGDTYFLLQGTDRELLVRDAARRAELWTPACGPAQSSSREKWLGPGVGRDRSSRSSRGAACRAARATSVELEAQSFPLPALGADISVRWITTGARRGTNSPGP